MAIQNARDFIREHNILVQATEQGLDVRRIEAGIWQGWTFVFGKNTGARADSTSQPLVCISPDWSKIDGPLPQGNAMVYGPLMREDLVRVFARMAA